ncbi:MAG: GGDEF domain-containing protein [Oscillospiraceae bacterium]|nr:GGDEF domain-containing protein [Oscillospiraceae bacterium]
MTGSMSKKLKIKYIAIIALVTAAFVAACITYMFVFRENLQEDNKIYFDNVAVEAARSYESELRSLLTSAETLAKLFPNFNTMSEAEKIEHLQEVASLNDTFYDLVYINANGEAISPNNGSAILSRRSYFEMALKGVPNISEVLTNDFTGTPVNVFAVPSYTGQHITGVLACAMETADLVEILNTDTFGGKAANYIINSDGVVILPPNKDILGLSAGITPFESIEPNSDEPINLTQRDAHGNFTFTHDSDTYYASFDAIDANAWIVLTVALLKDINSVTNNVFALVMVFTVSFTVVFTSLLLIFGVFTWFSKRRYNEVVGERDYLKYTDALTEAPSYEKFIIDVNEAFNIEAPGKEHAMISMDISKFRTVNDHLGHDEGSKVLKKLADVVGRNVKDGEAYTRVSADHFYILIKYETEEHIFERINSIINDAYYDIQEFKLVLLFGIYKIDDVFMDLRSMVDRADLARKTIKDNNESTSAFFNSDMLSKIREEKKIENVMESALECNEFKVFLQPKYDLQNRSEIIGAEALVRWFRDGKMIPPGAFIPIFEKNGFILKTDRFVFEEVCKQQRNWLSHGYSMKTISVNVSRMNLYQPNFAREMYDICAKYEVPTKYFEVEITESVAFENLDVLTRVFRELKNYGFHISIDDFGTGYSSLNMLRNLPVDILKIDRSFLTESYDKRANDILSHVISLALALHMKTICEGIETKDQAELLKGFGCDMAQGFYFARPMPIEEYEKLLYSTATAK